MISKEQYVSYEIISKLPNWLIHFLWFLLEEYEQIDMHFDGQFSLRQSPSGQDISCQVNGCTRQIHMSCPQAVDADVTIVRENGCLTMRLLSEM